MAISIGDKSLLSGLRKSVEKEVPAPKEVDTVSRTDYVALQEQNAELLKIIAVQAAAKGDTFVKEPLNITATVLRDKDGKMSSISIKEGP